MSLKYRTPCPNREIDNRNRIKEIKKDKRTSCPIKSFYLKAGAGQSVGRNVVVFRAFVLLIILFGVEQSDIRDKPLWDTMSYDKDIKSFEEGA